MNVITDRETGRPRGFAFVEMEGADAAIWPSTRRSSGVACSRSTRRARAATTVVVAVAVVADVARSAGRGSRSSKRWGRLPEGFRPFVY